MPASRLRTSPGFPVISRRSALAGHGLVLAAAMLAALPALAQHQHRQARSGQVWSGKTSLPDLPFSFATASDQLHAQNHPECTCRAGGASFQLGAQICIGDQLVRCSMDLNVTSWKSVGSACPQS